MIGWNVLIIPEHKILMKLPCQVETKDFEFSSNSTLQHQQLSVDVDELQGVISELEEKASILFGPRFCKRRGTLLKSLLSWLSHFCRSFLAGCRSTFSMLKIKVRISETKYLSFYKSLVRSITLIFIVSTLFILLS